MKEKVKARANEIFKTDTVNLIIAGAIYAVLNIAVANIGGNIITNALSSLANSALAASMACFYFRAFNRGKSDFADMYIMFIDKANLTKMATIVLAMWVFWFVIDIISALLMLIPLVNLLAIAGILFIGMLLSLVWYLYVSNTAYPTDYYFNASGKYIMPHLFDYLFFCFGIILLSAMAESAVAAVAGDAIAGVLTSPFDVFINLAHAGFVANIIPDEWYAGRATF